MSKRKRSDTESDLGDVVMPTPVMRAVSLGSSVDANKGLLQLGWMEEDDEANPLVRAMAFYGVAPENGVLSTLNALDAREAEESVVGFFTSVVSSWLSVETARESTQSTVIVVSQETLLGTSQDLDVIE